MNKTALIKTAHELRVQSQASLQYASVVLSDMKVAAKKIDEAFAPIIEHRKQIENDAKTRRLDAQARRDKKKAELLEAEQVVKGRISEYQASQDEKQKVVVAGATVYTVTKNKVQVSDKLAAVQSLIRLGRLDLLSVAAVLPADLASEPGFMITQTNEVHTRCR